MKKRGGEREREGKEEGYRQLVGRNCRKCNEI